MTEPAKALTVLHISTPLSWRGGEQQLVHLLAEQKALQSYILTPPNSLLADHCIANGYKWFPLKKKGIFSKIIQLKHLTKKYAIDIIHTHDAKAHTIAYLATLLGMQVPIIVSRRVDFPIKNNPFSKRKYTHPSIKRIITVSQKIADILEDQLPIRDRLTVVHSGVNTDRFKDLEAQNNLRWKWDIPDDHWLIGNTSALADHKDYYTFIDTAAYVQKQGLRATFFIIGDGPEAEAIRQYIKSRGLSAVVFMTGFRDDVGSLLSELDIYLMTSKTEGLGTSVLDAFAAGVPVVATQAGGIPEMIQHAETGLLAPVGDAKALSEALIQLTQEPKLRSHLVANAKQVLPSFSKSRMVAETYKVYKAVMAETRS